jgi:glutathione-regulated potassium-efflux system ancillary protein KefG
MPRVLIVFAHPALHRSRVNRAMAAAARELEDITLHDLYAAYPDHDIDVDAEKRLLIAHDALVFQHPFYWYSTPALLKDWQDHVLEFGWAYGPGGAALRGKTFLSAITTGGSEGAYSPAGFHGRTVRELLAPIDQTAKLCGFVRLPPFVVHGANELDAAGIASSVSAWGRVLRALRDGRLPRPGLDGLPRLNVDLDVLIGGA